MSNLEHYFENLLYYGEDIKGEANKNALTEEQQKSVEQCAQYVIYSLFGTRDRFDEWKNREPASPWHRVEDGLPDDGEWVIFTNGKVVTVERFKEDAYNHFFPASEWFDFEDAIAWMPLPEPPGEDA